MTDKKSALRQRIAQLEEQEAYLLRVIARLEERLEYALTNPLHPVKGAEFPKRDYFERSNSYVSDRRGGFEHIKERYG